MKVEKEVIITGVQNGWIVGYNEEDGLGQWKRRVIYSVTGDYTKDFEKVLDDIKEYFFRKEDTHSTGCRCREN